MPRIAKSLALLFVLTACRQSDPLLQRVRDTTVTSGALTLHTIYALPPFTDAPMPVYFSVTNGGSTPDTLRSASSPSSAMVMFHGEAMREVGAQAIAPGDSLVLAPGGIHLMLSPPLPMFARGDSLDVTLHFARAGDVRLWAPVIDYDEVEQVR